MSAGSGSSAFDPPDARVALREPRSYGETLEAWKTSCPRLTIWEDAIAEGLVRVERGAVVFTSAGRSRVLDLA
jgi:hypothetical protein